MPYNTKELNPRNAQVWNSTNKQSGNGAIRQFPKRTVAQIKMSASALLRVCMMGLLGKSTFAQLARRAHCFPAARPARCSTEVLLSRIWIAARGRRWLLMGLFGAGCGSVLRSIIALLVHLWAKAAASKTGRESVTHVWLSPRAHRHNFPGESAPPWPDRGRSVATLEAGHRPSSDPEHRHERALLRHNGDLSAAAKLACFVATGAACSSRRATVAIVHTGTDVRGLSGCVCPLPIRPKRIGRMADAISEVRRSARNARGG